MIRLSFRDIIAALKTYHGTDGRYLERILSEGLLAQKPNERFDKGVYLTSEIEKAARYAVDGIEKTHGIPVILEVSISRDKRINKIYRDKLDRDEDHLYDENDSYDADIEDLERNLEEVIKSITGGNFYGADLIPFQFESYGDKSHLRGINIYKRILQFARQKGLDLNKVKQTMFSMLAPGSNYGNITIAEDGSLKLDTAEIENMHQQVYPKKLPPSVIKAVWVANVPKNYGGERMSISSKLLPQESRWIFDQARNLYNKYGFDDYSQGDPTENEAIKEELIEEIQEINTGGWFDEDIQKLRSGGPESIANVLMSMDEYANEQAFEGLNGKGTEFTKMAPQMALKYIQSL